MQVLGVPELTCYREQGEPLPVINLNKDEQVALTNICRWFKHKW